MRASFTVACVVAGTIEALGTRWAIGAECPANAVDATLVLVGGEHKTESLKSDRTYTSIPIEKKVDMQYVVDGKKGAPDSGAVLIKRIYQIPEDWAKGTSRVYMRRNTEREFFVNAGAYNKYHNDPNGYERKIYFRFHTPFSKDQTDQDVRTDTGERRLAFRYPLIFEGGDFLAKPLILTWKGLGPDRIKCLNFNLNEGGGRYRSIEIYVYELQPRVGESEEGWTPKNPAYVKISKTYQ